MEGTDDSGSHASGDDAEQAAAAVRGAGGEAAGEAVEGLGVHGRPMVSGRRAACGLPQ
jgi:hypothetical protein